MGSLRIALVAPPWFAVPPTGYGGIEWVVSLLAEGLVERGHDVTLFASGGSKTRAKLVSAYETPPSEELGDALAECVAVTDAYSHWREFDIIHDHTLLGLAAASAVDVARVPVVHTVHGQVDARSARLYRKVASRVEFVAISRSQQATLPSECSSRVIHNGIDTALFPMRAEPGEYLLFVGRMNADKGILQAIEIAKQSGRQLMILAKINEASERAYYETVVRPALAGVRAEFHEQAPHEMKVAAYQHAFATLFPILWPEPFGLVMAESMACGTPVIAFRRGSVPEVVADGKTGFICDSVEEAVEALERVPSLDRRDCRRHVEEHFSARLNVDRHEALYLDLAHRSSLAKTVVSTATLPAIEAPSPVAPELTLPLTR